MDWKQIASTVLNSDTFSSLVGGKKAPTPPPAAPAPVIKVTAPAAPVQQGMSGKTVALIVGGVLAAVAVIALVFKK